MQRRWWIASLLFLSTLLNYFDRQIFSLVSPVLRVQFGLNAKQYSHLLTAFLVGYTVTQLFAGVIVDRLGTKRGLMLAMLWWSVAGACVAMAHTTLQLGIFLLLMGVGEAANWPTAVKAVRGVVPAGEARGGRRLLQRRFISRRHHRSIHRRKPHA